MILWWFFCKAAPVVLYNTYCRWAPWLHRPKPASHSYSIFSGNFGIKTWKPFRSPGSFHLPETFLPHTGPLSPPLSHLWAMVMVRVQQREREGGRQTEKGTCLDKEIQLRPPITDKAQTPWPDASAEGKNAQCVLAQWAVTSKFGLVFRWSRMSLCANSEGSTAHFCRTGSHMTVQHTALHHTHYNHTTPHTSAPDTEMVALGDTSHLFQEHCLTLSSMHSMKIFSIKQMNMLLG